ncbi:hypothetical protein BC629DRAFT_704711 [Irpex lacteus]|nr:hypothetical protein BC629DRAFT_704711 [Irpex lacteus]
MQERIELNVSNQEHLALTTSPSNTHSALAMPIPVEPASSTVNKSHEYAYTQSVLADLSPASGPLPSTDTPDASSTGLIEDDALVMTECSPSANSLGGVNSSSSGSFALQDFDIPPSTIDIDAPVAIPTKMISTQQPAATQASGSAEASSRTNSVDEPDILDDAPAYDFALALPTPQENTSLPIIDTKADVTFPADPITVSATEPDHLEIHSAAVSGADPSSTASLSEVVQKAEPSLLDRTDPPLSSLDAQAVLPPDTTRSAGSIVADNSLTFSEAADNNPSTAFQDGLSVTTFTPQDPPSPRLPPSSLPLSPSAVDIDNMKTDAEEGLDDLDQNGMECDSLPLRRLYSRRLSHALLAQIESLILCLLTLTWLEILLRRLPSGCLSMMRRNLRRI